MVGSFVANMIQGFASEKLRMGDEGRAALAAQKEAEAKQKNEAMKIVANHLNDKEFIQGKLYDTSYFKDLAKKAGYETDELMPHLTQLANNMADVGNTFKIGSISLQKPNKKWDEDLRPDNPLRAGGTWLRYHNQLFSDENMRNKILQELEDNPTAAKLFYGDLNRYTKMYIDGQLLQKAETQYGDRTYRDPKVDYSMLYEYSKTKPVDTANETVLGKAVEDGQIEDPSKALVFTFRTPEGKFMKMPMEYTDSKIVEGINNIAILNGYKSAQEYIDDVENGFSDRIRAKNPAEAYHVLTVAAGFEMAGYGALNSTAGGDEAMRVNLGMDLQTEFGDDARRQVQSLVPIVTIREEQKSGSKRDGYIIQLAPPEDYFVRNKLNKSKIQDQYDASEVALANLNKLQSFITDGMTPTGLKAAIQKAGFGIAGETGQLEQFFGELDTEAGTTAENLIQGAIDKGFLSKEAATNLSIIDSLKLSLAAQMARAVDPSGRLSNQDFEIQLQRLGASGIFTSKIQAGASLRQVIEDFKRTRRRLVVLNEVASADKFGVREAKVLKADRIARQASTAVYKANFASRKEEKNDTKEKDLLKGFVLVPTLETKDGGDVYYNDGQYRDAQGNDVGNTVREKTTEKLGT